MPRFFFFFFFFIRGGREYRNPLTRLLACGRAYPGNRTPEELDAARLVWPVAGEEAAMPEVPGCPRGRPCVGGPTRFDSSDPALSVTLRPMDIRTFIVTFA